MYAHNIISWHKDEQITLEQAFEFGKEFAEKWFSGLDVYKRQGLYRDTSSCFFVSEIVSSCMNNV